MEVLKLDSIELKYQVVGRGEPVLLIHCGLIADAFVPVFGEQELVRSYELIHYHRYGYGGSTHSDRQVSIADQASHSRALLENLGIERCHVVGHSYGGLIALQLVLEAPEYVASLALLEPAFVLPSEAKPTVPLPEGVRLYAAGQKRAAVDFFLRAMLGADYRGLMEHRLPPGAYETAVNDIDTLFLVEAAARGEWNFTRADAARITQPAFSIVGADSAAPHQRRHRMTLDLLPHAEAFSVAHANHGLPIMEPKAVADGLRNFFLRYPMARGIESKISINPL
ncbi:MAG: alpha/beta hydrolase [Candidatus Acidiferrales bacterium]